MRKLIITILLAFTVSFFSSQAISRDDRLQLSIKDALSTETAKKKLNAGIRFYFGSQGHPEVAKKLGEYSSNKKTNAFGKSDQAACEWAFLSAMLGLQKRALREGGDAVINIYSNYKNNEFKNNDKFECGAGSIMAGVALKGTVVKLK